MKLLTVVAEGATVIGIHLLWCPEGAERLEFLRDYLADPDKYDGARPYAVLEMPCGEVVTYKTIEDFPLEDVLCTCGDPSHWFVKWEVMPKEVDNG